MDNDPTLQIPTGRGIGIDVKTGRVFRSTMSVDTRSVVVRDGNEGRNPESSPTGQSCVVCQAEMNFVLPATISKEWKTNVKQFFCRHFPVAQFIASNTMDFPFCFACSKQLDKLINIENEAELLAAKFKSLKDSMVSRSAEAFLQRLKSECYNGIERTNFTRGSMSRLSSLESLVYAQSDSKSVSSMSTSDHSVFGSEQILRK
ncbi:unnamed protein product [Allacma fusca]|uniref:Uncharacterized protein n=1 Tax=Allacma fusca TaxID=39272 RepID=A0A8J2K4Y6_9HEXA|nr:unnamed protein product [Allacma fusca]